MRFWPFGRKSHGTSEVNIADVFAAMTGGDLLESAASIIRGAPTENTTVAGGIRQVSTAAWSIPWYVKVATAGDKLDDAPIAHPVRSLLAEPNPWMPWEGIVEHVIAERVLHGRAFLLLTNLDMEGPARRGSTPSEIIPLPYGLVSPIPSTTSFGVDGYRISLGRSQVTVHPDHIVDVWGWSPKGLMQEVSDLQSGARSIEAQNVARRWNNNLLRRGARPMSAWVTDLDLTDPQIDALEKRLASKYGGADNVGKPIVSTNGFKPQDVGWTPEDMEWTQGIREARREIAIGMGLPPELLGDPEVKTYANAEQARLALYEDRAFPLLRSFAHVLRLKLRAWYPEVDFFLDMDAVPAIQARRADLSAKRADLIPKGALTPNEVREEFGYEPKPGGDSLMMPMSMVPIGESGPDDEGVDEGDPDEDESEEQGADAEEEAGLVDRVPIRAALARITGYKNGGSPRVVEH